MVRATGQFRSISNQRELKMDELVEMDRTLKNSGIGNRVDRKPRESLGSGKSHDSAEDFSGETGRLWKIGEASRPAV